MKNLFMFGLISILLLFTSFTGASEKYGMEEQIALEYVKNALYDSSIEALKDKLYVDPGFIYLNDLDFDLFILEEIKDWYVECISSGEITECNKISTDYVDTVIGKYLPESTQIIIRESSQHTYSECFLTSLLIHEVVHFYQALVNGSGATDMVEWEAYGMQMEFLKTACPDAIPEGFENKMGGVN